MGQPGPSMGPYVTPPRRDAGGRCLIEEPGEEIVLRRSTATRPSIAEEMTSSVGCGPRDAAQKAKHATERALPLIGPRLAHPRGCPGGSPTADPFE
jgi:hypothetical protein